MQAQFTQSAINIMANPSTFKAWWAKVQRTTIAAKYCRARRVFGVYLITPDSSDLLDAVSAVWAEVPQVAKVRLLDRGAA